MRPPIPRLEDYGISERYGFLPAEPPLQRLQDPYYAKWEAVASNLQALILARRLREVVQALPTLSTDHLLTEPEWRRAYSILAFILHGYIWGGDVPAERIPQPLAIPLLQTCEHLELPPVATYAGLCLWNWRALFDDETIDQPENLATMATFTGSLDESWFYLISVAIEARGAPLLPLMLNAMEAALLGDASAVTAALQAFAERLDDIGTLLNRMYENCDPHVFYHRIRPFLAGSNNMTEAGLPRGVLYEDGSGTEQYRHYGGGSNAQSSIIQFFDVVLGVTHRPTGTGPPPSSSSESNSAHRTGSATPEGTAPPPAEHNFIHEMRRYMPGPHARFLNDLTAAANIRDFVRSRPFDRALSIAYDASLAMLRALRDKHLRMVSRYIVIKSREARPARSLSPRAAPGAAINIATATSVAVRTGRDGDSSGSDRSSMKGTGGTALIPFLKQARDETAEPAVDAWARRLLGDKPIASMGSGHGRKASLVAFVESVRKGVELGTVGEHADGDRYIVGLAGTWGVDDDEGGGICHW